MLSFIRLTSSCLLSIVLASQILSGCHGTVDKQEKPVLTVSILPHKYFLSKITGNRFEIIVMVPPGASPEAYEPEYRKMIGLTRSSLYFLSGYLDFENNSIRKAITQKEKIVDTSEGLDLIETEHVHGSGHERIDPHIWLSTANAKKIAGVMAENVARIDPANEQFYRDNYKSFMAEIDSVDSYIRRILRQAVNKKFLIFHPALGYFARDYGLEQVPVEDEGKSPSIKHMTEVIKMSKEEGLKKILIQRQFDIQRLESLAAEIGAKLGVIDPLDENWAEQMKHIAGTLQ